MTPLRPANPNDKGPTLVADLADLLRTLGLPDLQALEDYCEDDVELLLSLWMEGDDVIIYSLADQIGTSLVFPCSVEWLHDTLDDIEYRALGFIG